jgi:hypothetical protein
VRDVLFLHFFEIFEKQNGIERVVALLLQLVDNPALTDHALFAVCYEAAGLRQFTQHNYQRHAQTPAAPTMELLGYVERSLDSNGRSEMAKRAKKHTARGHKQDRARVAGGQDYEVRYTANKTRKSAASVKKAVKKVGSSRKRVVKALKRGRRKSGRT